MEIQFDATKDEINQEKHGISLSDAARLDWGMMLTRIDLRGEFEELREIGYAPMDGRLYCIVFVRRDEVIRVISLRKANRREVNRYEKG